MFRIISWLVLCLLLIVSFSAPAIADGGGLGFDGDPDIPMLTAGVHPGGMWGGSPDGARAVQPGEVKSESALRPIRTRTEAERLAEVQETVVRWIALWTFWINR
jgi:hypothetical protein